MAFSDPITVTINSVAIDHALVERSGMRSVYRSADGETEIVISHQEGKERDRRTVRFNRYDTVADPFIPAENREVSYSMYIVVDTPVAGFSNADITGKDWPGFYTWLSAANLLKVMGGES